MSTYSSLHYHLVFSTKNRRPFISPSWEHRLHDYLGGTVRGLDGVPQGIGGTADHVHLLVGLKPKHRLSDFMREMKKAASTWVHETVNVADFGWQDGYGAFTVSPTSRPSVKAYIANQHEHHKRRTFTEELGELLQRAGVDYDPRYLV